MKHYFILTCGSVIITDPHLSVNNNPIFSANLTNLKTGKWETYPEYNNKEIITSVIFTCLSETINFNDITLELKQTPKLPQLIQTNSQHITLFNTSIQLSDINQLPLPNSFISFPWGVITKSGYGNGTFNIKTLTNTNKEIIAIQIIFIDQPDISTDDDDIEDDAEDEENFD